ncbi:MAG: Spy/CpxP family protein refolding chaperone [Paracoccaceae bacterium]
MKSLLLSAALALVLPGMAVAQMATPQEKGLSAPVIMLMPAIMKNVDTLGLDDTQKAALDEWMKVAPQKRGALEDETAVLRAQMKEAILANAPVAEREALAQQIGANETALVMMRSGCVDNLRTLLTPEQFASLLDLAAAQ